MVIDVCFVFLFCHAELVSASHFFMFIFKTDPNPPAGGQDDCLLIRIKNQI